MQERQKQTKQPQLPVSILSFHAVECADATIS